VKQRFFVGYNFKISIYSEAMSPLDVYTDTDEVELNSVEVIFQTLKLMSICDQLKTSVKLKNRFLENNY